MAAYKRSDWNDLLDDVNDVLQNPPSAGCDPVDPIPHVGPDHRWAKSDIREVQDKIKETCPDISFGTIPDLWKQSIIDEINDKLGEAWCNCECPCPDGEEGNREFVLRSYVCKVNSNCYGDPLENVITLNGEISAYSAAPGVEGRTWRVLYKRQSGSYQTVTQYPTGVSLQGPINCDGTLRVNFPCTFNDVNKAGVYVSCSNCESVGCGVALANAESTIEEDCAAQDPIINLILRLSCNSDFTTCCE